VVLEEFMKGIELSMFIITDGKDYVLLPEAKDYKRIGENDTGLNTGGMGAVSPVLFADITFKSRVEEQIIKPTLKGLQSEQIPYIGFLFLGLMNVEGNPKVIEYNARMGDPESEVVFPRIKSDVVELFNAATDGSLKGYKMEINPQTATTIMLVSGGYPEYFETGKVIKNLAKLTESTAFHAGTLCLTDNILTNGGRVVALTSLADSMKEALQKSLRSAQIVDFEKKYYRTDIGFDLY
jgi:phosphoribosylamine--glycine ligase